jgi:hypothetical protein
VHVGIRHRLGVVLTAAVCAVVAGYRSYAAAIAEWVADPPADTAALLGIDAGRRPSEAMIRRLPTPTGTPPGTKSEAISGSPGTTVVVDTAVVAATDRRVDREQSWQGVLATAQDFDDYSRAGTSWMRPVSVRLVEAAKASSLAQYWPYWSMFVLAFATSPEPWQGPDGPVPDSRVPVVLISGGDEYGAGTGHSTDYQIVLATADAATAVQTAAQMAEQWHASVEGVASDDSRLR